MHTLTTPPVPRLRDLLPAAPPQARLRDLVAAELEPALLWRAEHTDSEQLVTGGTEQVRLLTQAIDGSLWPYTIVTTLDGGRWFQVLGTAQACVFEVGDLSEVFMVARRGVPPDAPIPLPVACRYWIPAARASELLTADVAAHLGMRHLRGHDLPYGFELRPVYHHTHSRT